MSFFIPSRHHLAHSSHPSRLDMLLASITRVTPIRLRWIRRTGIVGAIALDFLLGHHSFCNFQKRTDESNIAILNEKVWAYKEKLGTLPDLNLVDLYRHGLTKERIHRTPFGGYYRLDPKQSVVYNPHVASR